MTGPRNDTSQDTDREGTPSSNGDHLHRGGRDDHPSINIDGAVERFTNDECVWQDPKEVLS